MGAASDSIAKASWSIAHRMSNPARANPRSRPPITGTSRIRASFTPLISGCPAAAVASVECAAAAAPLRPPSRGAASRACARSPRSCACRDGARSTRSSRERSPPRTDSISSTLISIPYPFAPPRRRARPAATGCGTAIQSTCGCHTGTTVSRSASCTSSGTSSTTSWAGRSGPAWAAGHHEDFADWRDAAGELPCRLPAGTGRSRRRYFRSAKEVWARGYAQHVLARSGDPWLEQHLASLQAADDVFLWPTAEFAPVGVELERVLERLGLLRRALTIAA